MYSSHYNNIKYIDYIALSLFVMLLTEILFYFL